MAASAAKKKQSAKREVKREKNVGNQTKPKKTSYREALQKAFDDGYNRGWDSAETMSQRRGVITASSAGYNCGASDNKKMKRHEEKARALKSKSEKKKSKPVRK